MYEQIVKIKEKNLKVLDGKTGMNYKMLMVFFCILLVQGIVTCFVTIANGLELWGIDNKSAWGVTIVNFVFWIGLAHSGTLISAILYLFHQSWRNAINRVAETMTLIAILCSCIFLLMHTGRPWFSWLWIVPYPNQFGLWVNFRSPLFWDFIAVLTYFVVSVIFWYMGMIPDLAYYSTKTKCKLRRKIYSFFSIGWVGSAAQWRSYLELYGIIAGVATALVISVHSVVSMDFALTAVPGWHSTIFPPYFVIGAIFSGLAFVVLLINILRQTFDVGDFITDEHLDKLNKMIFFMSWLVLFSYIIEIFGTFFNDDVYETSLLKLKMHSPVYWCMVIFNCMLPLFYISKHYRMSSSFSTVISIFILAGMWLERYNIVVYSQENSIIVPDTINYTPSFTELSIFLGSIGLFGLLYMLFIKLLPIIPTWELLNDEKKLRNNLPR